jgi:hypothetical protein
MINREAIYAALFAKLAASAGYALTSRRLKHWNDVSKEQQPALFMAQGNQTANTVRGQPTRWTLSVDAYIYARTDGAATPGLILNPLLDAVEAALAPNAIENAQTLGGLVEWCRIEGAIETDEGTLGDQAVAIVPISILVSS